MKESKRSFYMMLTYCIFIIECFILSVLISFIFIETTHKIIGIFVLIILAVILVFPLRYFYNKLSKLIDNETM